MNRAGRIDSAPPSPSSPPLLPPLPPLATEKLSGALKNTTLSTWRCPPLSPQHGASLPADRLGLMDRLYALTPSRNNEIRLRWQRLCIALRAEWVVPEAVAFVKSQAPRYSPR